MMQGGAATTATGAGAGAGSNKINGNMNMKKVRLPSPKEMVAHYESKGMQPQEASLKVIQDLQDLLLKVVVTNKKNNNTNNRSDDVTATTIRRLESKLDSKPGYPQTLAIGIVSGAVFQVFPQVAASVANIWNSVTSSSSPS